MVGALLKKTQSKHSSINNNNFSICDALQFQKPSHACYVSCPVNREVSGTSCECSPALTEGQTGRVSSCKSNLEGRGEPFQREEIPSPLSLVLLSLLGQNWGSHQRITEPGPALGSMVKVMAA